jgi:hypothetical protein
MNHVWVMRRRHTNATSNERSNVLLDG